MLYTTYVRPFLEMGKSFMGNGSKKDVPKPKVQKKEEEVSSDGQEYYDEIYEEIEETKLDADNS